jgi:hypothetical protein
MRLQRLWDKDVVFRKRRRGGEWEKRRRSLAPFSSSPLLPLSLADGELTPAGRRGRMAVQVYDDHD